MPDPASNRAPPCPKYSGDRQELLNIIWKVHSTLAGENSHFSVNQHKLHYIYGYLKGNAQSQIQPYISMDKISLEDVKALIKILKPPLATLMRSEWHLGHWTASCKGTLNLASIKLNFNV
jgi:hypothetical protein